MLLFRPFLKRFLKTRKGIVFNSLQVSLTVGVASFMAIGLGGTSLWTTWRMEKILVNTYKQDVFYIANRFPDDVLTYSEDEIAIAGVQPAINNLSTDEVWLWIENGNEETIAQSMALSNRSDQLLQQLQSLPTNILIPQVYNLEGRYVIFCSIPLVVKGTNLGNLFVTQDVTRDQMMLLALIHSLSITSILAVLITTIAVSIYIKRSLRSLRQMSQLAGDITPQNLTEARLQLEHAPQEVRELAQACNTVFLSLSETWEQQRQLVSNVSHELRTPLTIVKGYIQSLLRRGDNLTEAQREALTVTAVEAERTIQLLQDLLDLARAESGATHLQVELFILNDLVAEVVGMSKQVSQREICMVFPDLSIRMNTDRDRVKQVLINLIDNALKYSPENEPVTVAIIPENKVVNIEVRDRGYGIPLIQQNRIFERFYRVDEARTRSGGCGLGLAIVKTLLEQMGGSITVRSQPHQGSTFIITLPMI